jgi:hypothetical protein
MGLHTYPSALSNLRVPTVKNTQKNKDSSIYNTTAVLVSSDWSVVTHCMNRPNQDREM